MKGKMRISIIDLVYLAYIIRLITGSSLAEIIRNLLSGGGNLTGQVLDFALGVLDRLEAEGLEIAVNATVVTYVKNKLVRPAIGRKKLVDIGFAVLTV